MLESVIREQLAAVVGGKWFKDDPESLVSYSYDATPLYQAMPDGVIFPGSTQEVSDIVKICSKHRIPVITRGLAAICAEGPFRFRAV